MLLHVLLYGLLCAAPALVLIPLRILDREPGNQVEHYQEQPGDDDAEMRAAA